MVRLSSASRIRFSMRDPEGTRTLPRCQRRRAGLRAEALRLEDRDFDLLLQDRGEVTARGTPAERAGEKARRRDQLGQSDAARDTEPFEHVDEILGREVAGCARRVGTSAEAS